MRNARILFVDDEPNFVLTMPHILRQHGYQVTVSNSVQEAISLIGNEPFDVLISDLYIGEQDNGLSVISTMRRTQPNCMIMILTGFPGFDSAVEAMRNQVDEYLIKPVPLPTLMELIEQKLAERGKMADSGKRIGQVIGENLFGIMHRVLEAMHADERLNALPLTDEERIEYTPMLVEYIGAMLEANDSREIEQTILRQAELQGIRRCQQGYTVPLVAASARYLQQAMLDVIHENVAFLDETHLLFDVKRLESSLGLQLEHSLQAYQEALENGGQIPAHRQTG
jgi:ActR/RegA family two-component response regulator